MCWITFPYVPARAMPSAEPQPIIIAPTPAYMYDSPHRDAALTERLAMPGGYIIAEDAIIHADLLLQEMWIEVTTHLDVDHYSLLVAKLPGEKSVALGAHNLFVAVRKHKDENLVRYVMRKLADYMLRRNAGEHFDVSEVIESYQPQAV